MRNAVLRRAALAALLTVSVAIANADNISLSLTGAEEVPANTSTAKGTGRISVAADKSISGTITTSGMTGVAAHIHEAEAGKNGPPIITLEKGADGNTWKVPAGAKLTDAQYASLQAGKLYVNVHSAEHKGGEIRAQLKP